MTCPGSPGGYYHRVMSDAGAVLIPHSLAEARLYVKTQRCASCGEGPLVISREAPSYDAAAHRLTVTVVCDECGQAARIAFCVREIERRGPVLSMLGELRDISRQPAAQVINPTRRPSRMIDVAGWVMLYTMLTEEARTESLKSTSMEKRAAVRRMRIEAAQCLDEALKFFNEDSDLPPREAFFTKESYRHFLDRPDLYTRQRLIEMRS
ncbi:MAG: hypothetical protein ACUVXJ_02180 [Phycisphaerae bacterium]